MQVSLFTSIVPYFLCLVPRGAKAQYSEAFLPPQQGGDLQPDGSLLHPTSWDFDCDPWRERPINPDADFHALNETSDVFDEWVCPEELRSVSGCGDFRHDTRGTVCETFRSLEKCSDQRVINAAQPLVPQMHVCFQHPIENYPDYGTDEGLAAPPLLGRHRPRWAKWGEYEYIPAERWLHNAEHGGAIFLYHPCISDEALCQLRQYIWSRPDDALYGEDVNDPNRAIAGKFRWILTPYPQLRTTMAIVTWGHLFFSECLNEPGMDRFLDANYRQAWEDFAPDGAYDYLHMGGGMDELNTPLTRSRNLHEEDSDENLQVNGNNDDTNALRASYLDECPMIVRSKDSPSIEDDDQDATPLESATPTKDQWTIFSAMLLLTTTFTVAVPASL